TPVEPLRGRSPEPLVVEVVRRVKLHLGEPEPDAHDARLFNGYAVGDDRPALALAERGRLAVDLLHRRAAVVELPLRPFQLSCIAPLLSERGYESCRLVNVKVPVLPGQAAGADTRRHELGSLHCYTCIVASSRMWNARSPLTIDGIEPLFAAP